MKNILAVNNKDWAPKKYTLANLVPDNEIVGCMQNIQSDHLSN